MDAALVARLRGIIAGHEVHQRERHPLPRPAHRLPRVRLRAPGGDHGDRQPHARLLLRPGPHVRARTGGRGGAGRRRRPAPTGWTSAACRSRRGRPISVERGDRPGGPGRRRDPGRDGRRHLGRHLPRRGRPAALAAGADVINDTSGLRDPAMADGRRRDSGATDRHHPQPRGPAHAVPPAACTTTSSTEVADFLRERVAARAATAGSPAERIIIDPGHDLNKNTCHTLELTRRLDEITDARLPALVAVSNKDFIGETLDRPQRERREGTIAANVTVCILKGRPDRPGARRPRDGRGRTDDRSDARLESADRAPA